MASYRDTAQTSNRRSGWPSRPREGGDDAGYGPYGGRPVDHQGLPYGGDLRTEGGMRSRRHGWLYPEMVWEPWIGSDIGYYDDYADHPYVPARPAGRYGYPDYAGRPPQGRYGGEADRDTWDRARDEVASWFGSDEAEERRRRDKYRGVGPRGYKRPDSRIIEDVNDRLSDHPALDASDIEVSVQEGEVTLEGHVSDRRDKRIAEDCADSVSGVRHVQNNLRVKPAEEEKTSG